MTISNVGCFVHWDMTLINEIAKKMHTGVTLPPIVKISIHQWVPFNLFERKIPYYGGLAIYLK